MKPNTDDYRKHMTRKPSYDLQENLETFMTNGTPMSMKMHFHTKGLKDQHLI